MISASQSGGLDITNTGTVEHDFSIKGTDVAIPLIAPGETAHLDLSGLDAGTYTVICQVAGHEASGMTAMLHLGAGDEVGGIGGEAAGGDRRPCRDDARADGPGDEGLDHGLPRRHRGTRRAGARADRARRRHQGVRAHNHDDPVAGGTRPHGRGDDLQRHRPGADHQGRPRRQGARRPAQRDAAVDVDPLPRADHAELDGRHDLHHAGPGEDGRELRLRMDRAGHARRRDVPLAPQRGGADPERSGRRVHHRRAARAERRHRRTRSR